MKKSMVAVVVVCAVSMPFVFALADEDAGHSQHGQSETVAGGAGTTEVSRGTVDSAVTLSADLRALLRQEMISLDRAMGTLGSDIVQGRWESASATAAQMRDSFIFKQALTQEQAHELHAKLSQGFIDMDVRFHKQADKLADATHQRDPELSVFYYGQMMNSCVQCHTTHAPNNFPGFRLDEPAGHGHD